MSESVPASDRHDDPLPQAELRPPEQVMRLERMGAFFPTRLSFMRSLIRGLAREQVIVSRPIWNIDDQGYGHAVYRLQYGGHVYSLVAFALSLPPDQRTDRVIAEAWDTSYVLFDGAPTAADIARLAESVPRQEAGRFTKSELVLSRANKSVRLFEHVVDCLANGEQPDEKLLASIGYLMRTTAVYGNGKFGIADRFRFSERSGLSGPFQAEMLTVWLIRGFTHDLVEHVARARNPERAVPLASRLKRHLGIGNATGLGMAPFLVAHPILLNNWMIARETALARVRAIAHTDSLTAQRIRELIARARCHLDQWQVDDKRQAERLAVLRRELAEVEKLCLRDLVAEPFPWETLVTQTATCSLECQELVVAMLLEPHGDLVDGLADCMTSDWQPHLLPAMTVKALRDLVDTHLAWALGYDFEDTEAVRRFWYVSEEKLEPRLGDRFEEPGAELEMPLDIARRVSALRKLLDGRDDGENVAELLLHHPEHRDIVRRVQQMPRYPYAEIQDNLIGADCLPIDMLRCKLSFFGATKFDPKSELWTRITMFQGAPLFDELQAAFADDWWLAILEAA